MIMMMMIIIIIKECNSILLTTLTWVLDYLGI